LPLSYLIELQVSSSLGTLGAKTLASAFRRQRVDKDEAMKTKLMISALVATTTAMAGCNSNPTKQETGTVSGAVVGGIVGSALTAGSTAGTVAGAAAGSLVGKRIGKELEGK